MKIKRYIGKDSCEAIAKVRVDLGSDAIILNTRKVKQKGFLKIFSKPLIEVLAAIDEEPIKSKKVYDNDGVRNHISEKPTLYQRQQKEINNLEDKLKNIELLLQRICTQTQLSADNSISNEIYQLNSLDLHNNGDKASKIIQIFTKNLLDNSVDNSIVDEIVREVKNGVSDDSNIHDIAAKMYTSIVTMMGVPQPIALEDNCEKAKVVAFVGPTGAGKTTTLAKIAAIFTINYNKRVGIISTDTYRIAAVEQLKTYAEILGIPVKVIYSPNEISDAIDQFADKDLILIDTAGRSHKNMQQFEELKNIITLSSPAEIYLLISLTTDYKVCREIFNSYSFLNEYKIIFTKADEAANQGIMLNIRKLTDKKLSYITTGQSVPDDIKVADIDKIAKKLLGSVQI